MQPLQPGDPARIGPYVLSARLGAGGMGQVYLGHDQGGRQAAVKVIHPGLTSDAGFRGRFAREIDAARRVRSPWTAAVLAAEPHADRPWLATEHVSGPALDTHVENAGPMTEQAVTILAGRLAHALTDLHAAGVVHRDLKPSNVLLAPDGPRLIDFGIARAADATKITGTGGLVGTPGFMSPEQAEGADAGAPSDVFSLACVLTYAATGAGPFGAASTPMAMLLRISDGTADVSGLPAMLRPHLEPCFAKDPAARPQAAALAAALGPLGEAAAAAAGLPARQGPVPTLLVTPFTGPVTPRPRGRGLHPLMAPLGTLAGLVAFAAVLALLLGTAGGGTTTAAESPRGTALSPIAYPEPARPSGTGSVLGRVSTGEAPQEVVTSPDGARAYVLSSRAITVIDIASGTPTATIGLQSAAALVVSPDSSRLYVPLLTGFLSVIDAASGSQVTVISIPEGAQAATITPDGKAVYVAHSDTNSKEVFLTVFDTAANAATGKVPVLPPDPARRFAAQTAIAAAPDSATVWVSSTGVERTGSVMAVDTAARSVAAPIEVPHPESLAVVGDRAYVFGGTEGITVIDTAARTRLGRYPVNGAVSAVAVAPNGRYLYVVTIGGSGGPSTIEVIDAGTAFHVHTIPTDVDILTSAEGIAVSPDGRTLLVVSSDVDAALVVDTTPYA